MRFVELGWLFLCQLRWQCQSGDWHTKNETANLEIGTPTDWCFKLQLETANVVRSTRSDYIEANGIRHKSSYRETVTWLFTKRVSSLRFVELGWLFLCQLRWQCQSGDWHTKNETANLEIGTPMDWCFKLQLETMNEVRFTRSDYFEANGIRHKSSYRETVTWLFTKRVSSLRFFELGWLFLCQLRWQCQSGDWHTKQRLPIWRLAHQK